MSEKLAFMSLEQAAKLLPPRPDGRPVHKQSLFRWITVGVNGVKLEHLRLGGRFMVTPEQLERFGRELAESYQTQRATAPKSKRTRKGRTPAQRARALEAARKALEG